MDPAATHERMKELHHEGNHVTFLNLYIDNRLNMQIYQHQYLISSMFQVLICGHVSPGVYAQAKDIWWFYPAFNVRFLDLLQSYSDVITSTFFGHEHTDSFRVVYSKQGVSLWCLSSGGKSSESYNTKC